MNNIAIFASGSGTNAQAITEYFKKSEKDYVKLILSNKADAFVLKRAEKLGIPAVIFNREQFYNSSYVLDALKSYNIEWVILAGFLLLVPDNILDYFPDRIINIHPALLPNYGGKGMYGMKVHETVVANKETKTGISIHFVNKEYDRGKIIFQVSCQVSPNDSPEDVAKKIHALEYEYFPQIIEKLVEGKFIP